MYNLESGAAEIDSEGVDEPRTGQFILRRIPGACLSVFNSRGDLLKFERLGEAKSAGGLSFCYLERWLPNPDC
jgi:hypothetical protein